MMVTKKDYYYKLKEIVVLQVMLCSDKDFLVEAIDKEDYDKMFANELKEGVDYENKDN